MSVLNKIVSYYPSVEDTTKGVETNLLAILKSNKHKEKILALRTAPAEIQKQLKEQLPCYTVAGTFSRRCTEGWLQPSGLACIDLDSAEGIEIPYLLSELRKLDCIAYAGLSCRGFRLFAIVVFKYPDKYERHYERLIQSFNAMGLPMGDTCHKTISQPRFVSYNETETQFYNHEAKPYGLLRHEKIFHQVKPNTFKASVGTAPENSFLWCNEQINKSYVFIEGQRHQYIIHLARYCNIKGLSEQDTLSGCLNYVQLDFDKNEITKIVNHIYSSQADSHNKIPFIDKKTSLQTPPIIEEENEVRKVIEGSWLGTDGKFYIPNPAQPERIAVYQSIEAYNKRLHLPHYIPRVEAEKVFLKPMLVDLKTLQTIED